MQWNAQSFTAQVVRPGLTAIDLYTPAAEQLVLGTAIQESGLAATVQYGGGPALGYFQMEPNTHNDIWTNFLAYKPALAGKVRAVLPEGTEPSAALLATNNLYAAAMCRVLYYRVRAPLPQWNDIQAMGSYWKQYYNTEKGAGTVDEYVLNWNRLTAPPAQKN